MGIRIEILFLLLSGACWSSDSRKLVTSHFSSRDMGNSNASVLQVNHLELERDIQYSEVVRDDRICTLCEDFASEALHYLALNKTQGEIIDFLHKSCSKLLSSEEQCMNLVDYYGPLFFLEFSSIQPGDFCRKVNLSEQMASISLGLSNNTCEICHHAVAEVLLKLKDPDTQLEILEFLLKGCNAMENYAKKCKRLVFEYGPVILVNTQKFLETNDVCMILQICGSPKVGSKQESSTKEASMVATS